MLCFKKYERLDNQKSFSYKRGKAIDGYVFAEMEKSVIINQSLGG